MTPLDYYDEQCRKGVILKDPQQLAALWSFQRVYEALITENKNRSGWRALFHRSALVHGLYVWGGVGIGKTFLMDCFYHCLPFDKKLRMHFHQFMQRVHNALTLHQGEKDPLQIIAKELAQETNVLCFDELFVSDITDAMLLGRLFKALFQKGVCLVATSNFAPDDLYKNGLQRLQFLPAIALLKKQMELVHIPTKIDYRLRHLKEAGVFYTPLDDVAKKNMEKTFAALTNGEPIDDTPLNVYDRSIKVKKRTNDIVWFEFADICQVPRSQKDYLWIAKQFSTVLISDIPVIPSSAKDTICLFVNLVDVFYDARVRLVMSAAEPVAELYDRGAMILEYARTHSRLLEMQSTDYFMKGFNQENE